MYKFTEEQLTAMSRPASETEETKLNNAATMLKKALEASSIVQSSKYEVFGQGSYANNTNIRQNSDIDINVCYNSAFYYDLPTNRTGKDYGLNNPVNYSFKEYKNDIEKMLVSYYGRSDIIRKNKCLTVRGNTNRIQVDVVPTWSHNDYRFSNSPRVGVILFSDNGSQKTINYPKQHIENGKNKNAETSRRFKRLTRIFKNIRIKMKDDKYYSNGNITSFLLECLAFNVPNSIYTKSSNCNWNNILKDAIYYLWESTEENSAIWRKWGEVSECLYLMDRSKKWDRHSVNEYMYKMWNYLQLGD